MTGRGPDRHVTSVLRPDEASRGDDEDVTVAGRSRPAPPVRALALAALLVPQAVVLLVQGVAPLLLREAPLVLLALHPFSPWTLLVSPRIDPVTFVAVIVAVRTVPCWGGYFVGRWYGVAALRWLSRRRRAVRVTQLFVRVSGRAGGVLLVVYPGATASVLAGANAMSLRRFAPLMLTGLLVAALITRYLAGAAAGVVSVVGGFVADHAVPIGLGLAALVVVAQLLPRHRARR